MEHELAQSDDNSDFSHAGEQAPHTRPVAQVNWDEIPSNVDAVIVGAGPAGSSTAYWLAQSGISVLVVDHQPFPRDKTCGDGLTLRAVAELDKLGMADWALRTSHNKGLKLYGFGQSQEIPWPQMHGHSLGSAIPRSVLDHRLIQHAVGAGALFAAETEAIDVELNNNSVTHVKLKSTTGVTKLVACRWLIGCDGVRSPIGNALGRTWHKDSVFAIASRSYVPSPYHDDPWITSHLELRDNDDAIQPGYGWIFPLHDGTVNLGVGALSSAARPASVAVKQLLQHYAQQQSHTWEFSSPPQKVTSALLPMGGAISNIAGANWALVGDAAACVNPLNGEGIDYALEGGRILAEHIAHHGGDLTHWWPQRLRTEYGASFRLARSLAGLLTYPATLSLAGPIAMRSNTIMSAAARCMGNLVSAEDQDIVARIWKGASRASASVDTRELFS